MKNKYKDNTECFVIGDFVWEDGKMVFVKSKKGKIKIDFKRGQMLDYE